MKPATWSDPVSPATTASALASGKFNLKIAFKAVIKSAYYRGISASSGTPGSLADVGTGRLLTPEMLTRKIAQDLLATGTYTRFHTDAVPYPEANKLFEK